MSDVEKKGAKVAPVAKRILEPAAATPIPAALAATPSSTKAAIAAPQTVAPSASPSKPVVPATKPVAKKPAKTPRVPAPVVPHAAIAAIPTPSAAVAAPQEDMTMDTTTINQTAETAQAKTQAMLGDVAARAQGAVEKSKKLLEEMGSFGKDNVEAVVESSKIAARGFETLSQDAAAYAKTSFEGASEALRTLASTKSPTEFLKLQGDYMRSAFDAMVAHSSRSTETVLKLAGEVAQPISNRISVAAEKIKIAA